MHQQHPLGLDRPIIENELNRMIIKRKTLVLNVENILGMNNTRNKATK